MVDSLTEMLEDAQSTSAVPRCAGDHLQELGPPKMKGAGGGDQQPARRKQLHGPQVDLVIAAERLRHGTPRFGEGGRVHHDGIEAGLHPGQGAERFEGVGLLPAHIRDAVERGVPGAAPQRLGAAVEGGDHRSSRLVGADQL